MQDVLQRKLERRISQLYEWRVRKRSEINDWSIAPDENYHPLPAPAARYTPFAIGSRWGSQWDSYWFRTTVAIVDAIGSRPVPNAKPVLHFNLGTPQGFEPGPEALLYINEHPVSGLDANHREVWLREEEYRSGSTQILIKAFSGINIWDRVFQRADLLWVDTQIDGLWHALHTAFTMALEMSEQSLDRHRLLAAVDTAILQIDNRVPHSAAFDASIAEAYQAFATAIHAMESDVARPLIHLVGHAHIDVAWLWRLKQTREKAARTFSSVLRLMDEYPDFRYIQSQPQLYAYIKQDYPEIYEQIKEKVEKAQWEPNGAMWVESDCNIPSGESLVRQLLYGKQFFKTEFGVENRTLWLPDAFGYNWQLPQIMHKSGITTFMTTKISWNQVNRPLYDTFWWRGLDGTDLLTHFITAPIPDAPQLQFYTYNGVIDAPSVFGTWEQYRQKDVNADLLLAFGYGDGGGGPTREMLETARSWVKVASAPDVTFSRADTYFDGLHEDVSNNPAVPVWDDELYLEYHRGTFTSQGRNKRLNRQSEGLLHDVEFLSTVTTVLSSVGYPKAALDEAWKLVLLNQFHDIIPGSSITEVYQDSHEDYERILTIGTGLLEDSFSTLFSSEATGGEMSTVGDAPSDPEQGIWVTNSLSWPVSGPVFIPWSDVFERYEVYDDTAQREVPVSSYIPLDTRVPGQTGNRYAVFYVEDIPAMGWKRLSLRLREDAETGSEFFNSYSGSNVGVPVSASSATSLSSSKACKVVTDEDSLVVENSVLRVVFNAVGQIGELYDKELGREVLAPGESGNTLTVFEDKPLDYDAWDIDVFYAEKSFTVDNLETRGIESYPDGSVGVTQTWRFMNSTIRQRALIRPDSRQIDFETEVDWQEHQLLLKAAFPVDIRATNARYDIQFGNMERPTHSNTTWDAARFEVNAHKWVDLSEHGYGVSLLNNCKYGHDVHGNTIRLTLLKSAIYPDKNADNGLHQFTYSLYPHKGNWFEADTPRRAYELNLPLRGYMPSLQGSSYQSSLLNEVAQSEVAQSEAGDVADELLPGDYRDEAKVNVSSVFSFCSVDRDHVMIETVKNAEDGNGIVLRVYEFAGGRGQCELRFPMTVESAAECNLLEEDEVPLSVSDSGTEVAFSIKPYEIKTIKVKMG